MALTFGSKIVSSKMDVLTELKQNLQTFLDNANEVLQLATSWLSNEDNTNNFTFADINKMIDEKLAVLGSTDFSVKHEKATTEQEFPTVSLPSSSASSTDQPLAARNGQISDELKTVMNQVKAMQDEMSFIITSSVTLSEKQSAMEECFESLSDKYSKMEQEKIREIEAELKSIYEKQKITTENQEKIMENFENKIQAVTEACQLQRSKMENCKREIQTVSDAQSDILENCNQLQCKINDEKIENEKFQKQSQQFLQDLNDVFTNIKELKTQISILENQLPVALQLEVLKNTVALLEANSVDMSVKFEEYGTSIEKFTRKNEETCQKLQKFEKKISTLETSFNETSSEARQLYQNMDTKYDMVCHVVAGRFAALEKLRDIFNKKLIIRKNNEKKLERVCGQMTSLLPKFSQLIEHKQAIGCSVCVPDSYRPYTKSVIKFPVVINNIGNHFNTKTGEFTAPMDGLYAASLSVKISGIGCLCLVIRKIPCRCNGLHRWCKNCPISDIIRERNSDNHVSTFTGVFMKAGEKLSVRCMSADNDVDFIFHTVFSCFKIN